MQKITIALLGRRLNAAAGETLVSQQKANRYRDAFLFNLDQGEAWLFDYGALICWNLGETERHRLCNALAEFIEEPIDRPAIEHYIYQHDEEKPFNIHHDLIRLPDNDKLIRLALSHAFAHQQNWIFLKIRHNGSFRKIAIYQNNWRHPAKYPCPAENWPSCEVFYLIQAVILPCTSTY